MSHSAQCLDLMVGVPKMSHLLPSLLFLVPSQRQAQPVKDSEIWGWDLHSMRQTSRRKVFQEEELPGFKQGAVEGHGG